MQNFLARRMKHSFCNSNVRLFIGCFLVLAVSAVFWFVCGGTQSQAQTGASDAIAIRVIPNPGHLSANDWFDSQNFEGSPQALVVDGYDAVRDGRTVYVNAANIDENGNLYTNIYLISFNQQAEKTTQDIFSRILARWTFNSNLTSLGRCRNDIDLVCLNDEECAIRDHCDSSKARVVRDTRRLADLAWLEVRLEAYQADHGNYPVLAAGTYLPHNTLSVWPSWQDSFARSMGESLPVDPVNRLGECPGFNEVTCWNEEAYAFSGGSIDNLPDNSLVYAYSTDPDGSDYDLYARLESGYSIGGSQVVDLDYDSYCLDFDGDGLGNPASNDCPNPNYDCNDMDPSVGSGEPENTDSACRDGSDNDCDGRTDCADSDCFGTDSCAAFVCDYDGICESERGETCSNCPEDNCCCPLDCGDGFCDLDCNECVDCPGDCYCGDGVICPNEECDGQDNCNSDCTWQVTRCYQDSDGDGYGDPDNYQDLNSCESGWVVDNTDCDDSDASVNPDATEVCDGLDNNCDGQIDEGFSEEECGYVCEGMGYDYNAARGNDLRCCGNNEGEGSPYESVEVSCSDGNDNDCDGLLDDADPDCTGICNNSGENDWINASTPGICNQCDYPGDQDGDQLDSGWGAYPGRVDDCDSDCGIVDTTISFSEFEPGGETSCDGLDNNCDGIADNISSPPLCTLQDGVCSGATQTCGGTSGWVDCGPAEYGSDYELIEATCDGLDNDCDGEVDEEGVCCEDEDGDGYFAIDPNCGGSNDCDDTRAWINPGSAETCDGFDNNCNSTVDEGCDDDSDGYCDDGMQIFNNNSMCPNTIFTGDGMWGDDCDDNNENINPGQSEDCGDGIDNNCDGDIDEGCASVTCYRDSDSDGYGNSSDSTTAFSCASGWVLDNTDCDDTDSGINPGVEEVCDDGVDNDCDGDSDCADMDCDSDPACGNPNCVFPADLPCTFP